MPRRIPAAVTLGAAVVLCAGAAATSAPASAQDTTREAAHGGTIVLDEIGLFGMVAMAIFLGILVIGFIYEWKKGALEWE